MSVIAAILAWSLSTCADVRAQPVDTASLEACVGSIEATAETLARAVPEGILSADRRLHHMLAGVKFLRESAAISKKRGAEGATALDRHLVDNGIEGCRAYHTALKARAFWYLFFVGSMSLFLLVLLSQMAVMMLTEPSRARFEPAQAPAPPSTASDTDRRRDVV